MQGDKFPLPLRESFCTYTFRMLIRLYAALYGPPLTRISWRSRFLYDHIAHSEFNWKHLQTVGCWLKGSMAVSTQNITRGGDKGTPKPCSPAMKLSCLLSIQDNQMDPLVETNWINVEVWKQWKTTKVLKAEGRSEHFINYYKIYMQV